MLKLPLPPPDKWPEMDAVHDLSLRAGTVYGSALNAVLRSAAELQHEIASLRLDRQAVMNRSSNEPAS